MSIIRVGLAETKNFSDGYDLIFGKKDKPEEKKDEAKKDEEKKDEAKKDA
ncbi:MAG: hypothetical protein K2W96_18660 [Gemmataceae bacterium]|nr:hypothetical protein [Gemmataceae bacterium]